MKEMIPKQLVRLFVSSPGDVEPERAKVRAVIEQVNRMLGDSLGIVLDIKDWKTHVVPDMGRPQAVINQQIGDYDIFVGILWKRFGTPTSKAESGTEEEFNIAYENWKKYGRPRVLFYFSQAAYMIHNATEAIQLSKVLEFKTKFWEQKTGLIMDYQTPEEFSDMLREHMVKVLQEWFKPTKKGSAPVSIADFTLYLKYLRQETMAIDIRGLVTGKGKLHQFPIDELYIPLRTRYGLREDRDMLKERLDDDTFLQEALQEPRLFIKGDPGSGKTTFLRLITYTLCQGRLGEVTKSKLTFSEPLPLPLLIRVGALSRYISQCEDRPGFTCPAEKDSPKWLLHYLESLNEEFNWKLPEDSFHKELEKGRCMILLDGLDEAPSRQVRVYLSRLAANLVKAYPKCQVVLTSRPAALTDGDAVPWDFHTVEIESLDDRGIEDFLNRWCSILYTGALDKSERYKNELREALRHGQIRVMVRTPVMLTALAVVHWNENRLPEQRAELYESVLTWLFRSREEKEGREKADRCRRLLQKLALAMFVHPEGRQRQVGLRWAVEKLAGEFKGDSQIEQAENFLHAEMMDSGVIVERELRVEFWDLSFQEYLAAYEIGGMLDDRLVETLFLENRLYQSEWREVVLHLGGVLYKQGEDRINYLIDRIIEAGPKESNHKTLPELAKAVALLGGIVQDLSPYKFEPSNPRYKEITHSVMGIFDRETFRRIPVQVREDAADALGRVGDPRFDREKYLWVQIPAGTFWMGAQKDDPKARNYDEDAEPYFFSGKESPVHEVELSEYLIGMYPVTVFQYRRFIEADGYQDESYWKAGGFGMFICPDKWEEQLEHPSRPVTNVSWYETKAYAEWAGCHLPTEAEWERSARGPGQDYRKYVWGNEEPDKEKMNFEDTGIKHPTPVGIFPESCSPEGVIDMAGNVWEWCEDWYCDYPSHKSLNPVGPDSGDYRILRGGSWSYFTRPCRSSHRFKLAPDYRNNDTGFRLVIGHSTQQQEISPALATAQQFFKQAGTTIMQKGKRSLEILKAQGRLNSFTPVSVLLATDDKPTKKDVDYLFQQSGQQTKYQKERAGILLYRDSPDLLVRIRIAEVRLLYNFVLIPIPFAAVELNVSDKYACMGLLDEYINRYLPGADLFDDRNAIGDTLSFFGRKDVLSRLKEELLRCQGVGLFGLRKSGKTSVIFQLGFALRNYPVVHIDLQLFGSKSRFGAELFNEILNRLTWLITNRIRNFTPNFELLAKDLPATELTTEFFRIMQTLSESLRQAEYEQPILCFFDEMERILPASTDSLEKVQEFNACFGVLRALSQKQQILSLLVADVHPDCNRINNWTQEGVSTNPVYNFFKEFFLSPFSEDDTKTMLADIGQLVGRKFEEDTLKEIHRKSGGNPFVARQLASILHNKIPSARETLITWQAAERYLENPFMYSSILKFYFEESIWNDLKKRNFESAIIVLRILACNYELDNGLKEHVLRSMISSYCKESQFLDALHWLESNGLISKEEVQEEYQYQIQMPLLSSWIRMEMTEDEIRQWQIEKEN